MLSGPSRGTPLVTPAKAGVQGPKGTYLAILDPRLRGGDEMVG
jgi:hypothetical protein